MEVANKIILEFLALDRLFNKSKELANVNECITCHYVFVILRAIGVRIPGAIVNCEQTSLDRKCRVDMVLETGE